MANPTPPPAPTFESKLAEYNQKMIQRNQLQRDIAQLGTKQALIVTLNAQLEALAAEMTALQQKGPVTPASPPAPAVTVTPAAPTPAITNEEIRMRRPIANMAEERDMVRIESPDGTGFNGTRVTHLKSGESIPCSRIEVVIDCKEVNRAKLFVPLLSVKDVVAESMLVYQVPESLLYVRFVCGGRPYRLVPDDRTTPAGL